MTTKTTMNLKEACEAYIDHMKQKGQSQSTLGTIQRTLALLIEEMGPEKEVGKILPVHVDRFFKSERATMQPGKDGMKPRAQASILQIRRIVRMALVHWHEQGLISKVPVPADEKRLVEKAGQRKAETAEAEVKPKRGCKAKTKAKVTPEVAESSEHREEESCNTPANEEA